MNFYNFFNFHIYKIIKFNIKIYDTWNNNYIIRYLYINVY